MESLPLPTSNSCLSGQERDGSLEERLATLLVYEEMYVPYDFYESNIKKGPVKIRKVTVI